MPAPHHLLIPYAASRAPGAQEALKGLALPHLDRLLARLSTADASPGEETSLTPPHERALAQALGLGTEDGLIPWAAWHRLQQGQPPGEAPGNAAWAFITPCQWQVTTDHITLRAPALREDWRAWASAWTALDAGPVAELLRQAEQGQPVRLTLSGEHSAQTFHTAPLGLVQRIQRFLRPQRFMDVREQL